MDTTIKFFLDTLEGMNSWCKEHEDSHNYEVVEHGMVCLWNALIAYDVTIAPENVAFDPEYADKFRYFRERIRIISYLID